MSNVEKDENGNVVIVRSDHYKAVFSHEFTAEECKTDAFPRSYWEVRSKLTNITVFTLCTHPRKKDYIEHSVWSTLNALDIAYRHGRNSFRAELHALMSYERP